jgi:hypothetical protein
MRRTLAWETMRSSPTNRPVKTLLAIAREHQLERERTFALFDEAPVYLSTTFA